MTYKEFLGTLGHPSEEEFNEIVKGLPEVSTEEFTGALNVYWNGIESVDDLAAVIADAIVRRYTEHAYVEEVYLELKEVCISDIETLEELKKLKEVFSEKGWKVADYNYLENQFIVGEQEKTEKDIREAYLKVINNLSTSKLKEIFDSYEIYN